MFQFGFGTIKHMLFIGKMSVRGQPASIVALPVGCAILAIAFVILLVTPAGFEPATYRLGGGRSIP